MEIFDDLLLNSNDLIRYKMSHDLPTGITEQREVLLVPMALWADTIERAHESVQHKGQHATVLRAAKHIYFTNMMKVVSDVVH
jgi:hypothetical protein